MRAGTRESQWVPVRNESRRRPVPSPQKDGGSLCGKLGAPCAHRGWQDEGSGHGGAHSALGDESYRIPGEPHLWLLFPGVGKPWDTSPQKVHSGKRDRILFPLP